MDVSEFAQALVAQADGQRHPRVRTGPRERLDPVTRQVVWIRDCKRCQACDYPLALHEAEIDHVIPWSAGGSDRAENLRLLCRPCNQQRSNFRGPLDSVSPLPIADECINCTTMPLPELEDRRRVWCGRCGHGSIGVETPQRRQCEHGCLEQPVEDAS